MGLKEFGRSFGIYMLKGLAFVKDPATGLRKLAIWLEFGRNKNKYAAILLKGDKSQVLACIIKGVDSSIYEDGALKVSTTDGKREILIPKDSIQALKICPTKEELDRVVKEGLDLEAFIKGSLYYTYIGMVYISTETVLAMFEMKEFQLLKKIVEEADDRGYDIEGELKEAATNLQDEPYSQKVLDQFLSKMGSLVPIFRNSNKLEVDQRIVIVTLFTNFLSSLLVTSMKDSKMQGGGLRTAT